MDKLVEDKFLKIDTTLKESLVNVIKQQIPKENHSEFKLELDYDNYVYVLTWQGRMFIKYEGGYIFKAQKEDKQRVDLERLQEQVKKAQMGTLYLTILIAFGAVIASIYYLLEIFHACHCPN